MYIVIFVNTLAVLFSYLSKYNKFSYGFELAFFCLILFYGVRYNYGNDYISYWQMFDEIASYRSFVLFDDSVRIEPGWILLNKIFSGCGFPFLVFFLTIFQFLSIYYFIKRFVPINKRYIALFIYLFSFDLMLLELSMMRQTIAIFLTMYAVVFLLNQKFIFFSIFALLAPMFHVSAWIITPAYIILLFRFKVATNFQLPFLLVVLFLFLSIDSLNEIFVSLITSHLNTYAVYLDRGAAELGSGLGLTFNLIIMLCILFTINRQSATIQFLYKWNLLAYIVLPFGFLIDLIARVGFYFSFCSFLIYPFWFSSLTPKYLRQIVVSCCIFYILYSFWLSLNHDIYAPYYSDYQSILFK